MTTPSHADREAAELWDADRRQHIIDRLLAARPAEFATPGVLDPRLGEWADLLAAGSGQNLVLTGVTGTGKTWAVWKAAETAVRAGYDGRVVITTAAELRRAVAPATADPLEFARCRTAGLLAIDDLFSFAVSEWDLDHLAELADARWSAQLPTVITSNKTTALKDLLGPRISSRLQHRALIITMTGADRRRQP